MNICIWFNIINQPWGGGNQFLKALTNELISLGHEVTHTPSLKTDLILINAHNFGPNRILYPGMVAMARQLGFSTRLSRLINPTIWLKIPRKGPPIIHRLDGVAELIRGRRSIADEIQPKLSKLSDATIFQSNYCKESFVNYGVNPERSTIIYNGTDGNIFYPSKTPLEYSGRFRILAASWSTNPRKGFSTFSKLSRLPGVEVLFSGRWCDSVDAENVITLGPKSSLELAEIMRNCHAYVHAAENEPCSNTILEALACGLPVLYLDSGGNKELAFDYGISISNDLFYDVESLRGRYSILKQNIEDHRQKFLIGPVAKKYYDFFEYSKSILPR